ncbi:MAG: PorT family protein [Pseudoflavonifractor sp.]|nr:PorT family protein [Alloprevotella sp.]MCM1117209.1 PorT family protein [Pseudoflavonifractor sp.]
MTIQRHISSSTTRSSRRLLSLLLLLTLLPAIAAMAQRPNDKLLNRPYADNRAWHLGFGVGLSSFDLTFTHNGFTTPEGETWFFEQPAFSPGFAVNALVDFRLSSYLNLRLSPGMIFGNRDVKMIDTTLGAEERQNIKSTFVTIPIDLRFSSIRWGNLKPYISAGIMAVADVAKKRDDFLRLKTFDTYLTVAIGCDFYLPYFKLSPELKFGFGLADVLQHKRPDLADNPAAMKFTDSLAKAGSSLVTLSFYFE